MTENEFILYDRLEIIKSTVKKYGEDNFYLSFSGGKDSTLVHHLLDEALPNNKILRCFINTGIEYLDILKFVKDMALKDDRIIVYNAGINIRNMLETYGYPFKSKEHSHYVSIYQNSGETKSTKRYVLGGLNRSRFACPEILQYQFSPLNNLKISDKCCTKLKKQTAHRFERERENNSYLRCKNFRGRCTKPTQRLCGV